MSLQLHPDKLICPTGNCLKTESYIDDGKEKYKYWCENTCDLKDKKWERVNSYDLVINNDNAKCDNWVYYNTCPSNKYINKTKVGNKIYYTCNNIKPN